MPRLSDAELKFPGKVEWFFILSPVEMTKKFHRKGRAFRSIVTFTIGAQWDEYEDGELTIEPHDLDSLTEQVKVALARRENLKLASPVRLTDNRPFLRSQDSQARLLEFTMEVI